MIETDSSNEFDPWQVLEDGFVSERKAKDVRHSPLQIARIGNVEPMDRQFGVQPKKTVPDSLHGTLFDQPNPTGAEIEAAGGDPAAVPPMQTYAILDAAKIVNLPELLGASGLEHRCLFKGKSYDKLKNVAPWIVRLEEGNDFTRRLFTGPEGINGLWDQELGIYIRSRAGLDDIRKHFRKFTRVQDENGKWFYFRFWESQPANSYFRYIRNDQDRVLRWFYAERRPLSVLIPDAEMKVLNIFTPVLPGTDKRPNAPFVYEEYERAAHRQGKTDQYERRLRSYLIRQNAAYAGLNEERQKELVKVLITQASQYSIRSERGVAGFAFASLLHRKPLGDNPRMEQALRSTKHEIDKVKEIILLVDQEKRRLRS
ncbi:DUF4123 domain-containing protein [Paracoccus onubensis]|uniref:DUF4123 domain-containing protein n=1 Tax=Paracoccus onubensis TaxID=1675788 RepID=UPI0027319DB0|nr:DUF4123 domain-containing protein [Paracoccus onubensis]MDP0927330.1 DUF4123 domain-containing protein [Paracoccus onubensis]